MVGRHCWGAGITKCHPLRTHSERTPWTPSDVPTCGFSDIWISGQTLHQLFGIEAQRFRPVGVQKLRPESKPWGFTRVPPKKRLKKKKEYHHRRRRHRHHPCSKVSKKRIIQIKCSSTRFSVHHHHDFPGPLLCTETWSQSTNSLKGSCQPSAMTTSSGRQPRLIGLLGWKIFQKRLEHTQADWCTDESLMVPTSPHSALMDMRTEMWDTEAVASTNQDRNWA